MHEDHPPVHKPASEVPSYVDDVPEPQRPPLGLCHAFELQLISPLADHHTQAARTARKAGEGQGTSAPRPRATLHTSHYHRKHHSRAAY